MVEKARELSNLQVQKKLSLPLSNGYQVESQEALSHNNQHEVSNYTCKNADNKQKFFNNLSIPKHYVEKKLQRQILGSKQKQYQTMRNTVFSFSSVD